ncbi:MAG: hypothetical protein ACYDBJ_06155 [Aggregatilineales bacterium]
MTAKKWTPMLPPKRAAKREVGVNVRFTPAEHAALEHIATYREITVTELVYHVVAQVALPQLREEMDEELAANAPAGPEASHSSERAAATPAPSSPFVPTVPRPAVAN